MCLSLPTVQAKIVKGLLLEIIGIDFSCSLRFFTAKWKHKNTGITLCMLKIGLSTETLYVETGICIHGLLLFKDDNH
jgi:hypothetical protein